MYRNRATIPEQLMSFARKWRRFGGREQMEAQTFLGELLDIYDAHYPPGTLFEQHTVRVKHAPKKKNQNLLFAVDEVEYTAERMDMYIPKVCVWEMKGPEETDLGRHHEQVLRYWARMRPRYMVLCNFKEFWIYDTDEENGQNRPKVRFTIDELPEYADALLFLRGEVSHFPQRAERVTREMASRLGQLVREATHGNGGKGVDRERITKFALECVFAMFAEDTDLFPRGLFSRSLEEAGRAGSLGPVYDLFEDLGRPDTEGKVNRLAPYVNGSLYDRRQARITLSPEHIEVLHSAARDFDWRDVRPEIFGSIFEQALDPADRHELGAHFTREEDILKVVTPTVLVPWRRKIRAAKLPKDVEKVAEEMRLFHVLDPACGCGNFLYVVYREMKRLESVIKEQWHWAQRRAGARKWAIPPPPQG
ncbi:MAG: class I SAM-dependent DNA methyltransferase, partial [Candidatus Omnitrophica bacterium]|nr:class I SAM-dependent DNA methyltransferase [Candidatus Omnitrophota bacterium]